MSDGYADDDMLSVSNVPPGLIGTSGTLEYGCQPQAGMNGSVRRGERGEGVAGQKEVMKEMRGKREEEADTQ